MASGGELHLALRAGVAPGADRAARQRQVRGRAAHGAAPPRRPDRARQLRRDRAAGAARRRGRRSPTARRSPCCCGSRPTCAATRTRRSRPARPTPSSASRSPTRRRRSSASQATAGLSLRGLHAHIGSQLLELAPFRARGRRAGRARRRSRCGTSAAVSACATPPQQPPPPRSRSTWRRSSRAAARARHGAAARLLIEPGRALCANAGVTLYTRGERQAQRLAAGWRSTAACPTTCARCSTAPLRGARRRPLRRRRRECALAGKHCESGDVIVRDALLDDPRPGDVVVTPATGAYGYAMANNYNGVPRPPVIFCQRRRRARGGAARELRGPDGARCR